MAGLVLGVRDRHYENILVRRDGLLFHIDFGAILGQTISIDTPTLAMTEDLRQLMGEELWPVFGHLCVAAFAILRSHADSLINLCCLLFRASHDPMKVRKFMENSLLLHLDESEMHSRIHQKVREAPGKFQTKMKNSIHAVAIAVRQTSMGSTGLGLSTGNISISNSGTNSKESTPSLSIASLSGLSGHSESKRPLSTGTNSSPRVEKSGKTGSFGWFRAVSRGSSSSPNDAPPDKTSVSDFVKQLEKNQHGTGGLEGQPASQQKKKKKKVDVGKRSKKHLVKDSPFLTSPTLK